MILFRNVLQGAAGGLLAGALLGVVEATWLLSSTGAPDLVAPGYAALLYGLIGLALGIGGGLVLTVYERRKPLGTKGESIAFAWGTVSAVAPMGGFILHYLAKKNVYAEGAVPPFGLAVIGLVVLVYALVALKWGAAALRGRLKALRRGPVALGLWGLLVGALAMVGFVPVGEDPRAVWAHGKGIPDDLRSSPNVLLLTVDTLRADHLGAYGRKDADTPAFDALASDAVVFEQHVAQASWTRASFASLFSSRIPSSHATATKAAMLPDDVELVSEVLQSAGMTTGNLANNINVSGTFNFDQGYDTFIYESPAYAFGATESVFGLTFYKVVQKVALRVLGKLGLGAADVTEFYQPADVVFADAKGFLTANKEARWYLGVHLMEPHDPYFDHPYLSGKSDARYGGKSYGRAEHEKPEVALAGELRGMYHDEIRHLDRELAGFIAWLKAEGLYDKTLIVLTADHGEEFAEHGGFWHGVTLYDEQIHVPLLVKLPGGELAGTRVPWQSRAIDVAPTITEALGVVGSDDWEGRDLLTDVRQMVKDADARAADLAAKKQFVLDHQAVVDSGEADDQVVIDHASALAAIALSEAPPDPCKAYETLVDRVALAEQDFEGNVLAAYRAGGFKLIRANDGNPRGLPALELFDIVADPGETKNLVGASGDVCGRPVASLPDQLGLKLREALDLGAAGSVGTADGAKIDDAERCKLCKLGYLSGDDCGGC